MITQLVMIALDLSDILAIYELQLRVCEGLSARTLLENFASAVLE